MPRPATPKPTKPAAQKLPRLGKTKAQLKREAYDLLGIHESDVLGVPKIEPVLAEAGVLEKVWDYLAASSDAKARALLAMRKRISTKQHMKVLTFESYCVAAKVPTEDAYGIISAELFRLTERASTLMAAKAMPTVVGAMIESAKDAKNGTRDRAMLGQHSGFSPTPKTSVVHVHGGRNIIGDAGKQLNHSPVAVLPPIEDEVRRISDRFNERFLPAPANVVPIDAQPVEEEDEDEDDAE